MTYVCGIYLIRMVEIIDSVNISNNVTVIYFRLLAITSNQTQNFIGINMQKLQGRSPQKKRKVHLLWANSNLFCFLHPGSPNIVPNPVAEFYDGEEKHLCQIAFLYDCEHVTAEDGKYYTRIYFTNHHKIGTGTVIISRESK